MKDVLCAHFPRCGGCLYLNMPFQEYLDKKKNFVLSAFRHEGLDVCLEPAQVIPLGHRRRATFAFCNGQIGFNGLKSHQIISLDDCAALTPALSAILKPLKALIKQIARKGDVTVLETPYGIDMHIKTGKEQPTLLQRELLAEFGNLNNVVRLLFNGEPILQKQQLPFPPDVFLQPSVLGEQTLIRLVMEHIETEKTVYDLFCGTGTFTKPLLDKKIKAVGYDLAADSVFALGIYGVKRDLFRNPLLPEELNQADAIIMDPPRAGAKAQTEQLALSRVSKVIMISCNPITAARDIKILSKNGWSIEKIVPVEQFIYTNHVEIVCVLTRNF